MLDLEQLINDCKKNNIKAQEQLYRHYSPMLFTVCLKYSRNYVEAQDHLQDAFILIFEKINQYGFKGSFDGWIKRVVVNSILQHYRSASFLNLVNDPIEDIVEVEIETEHIEIEYLMKIIQDLPDRYRLVFNLFVIDNYSHIEIANLLNISVGTSKSNLSRSKMILKEKIENYRGSNKIPSVR